MPPSDHHWEAECHEQCTGAKCRQVHRPTPMGDGRHNSGRASVVCIVHNQDYLMKTILACCRLGHNICNEAERTTDSCGYLARCLAFPRAFPLIWVECYLAATMGILESHDPSHEAWIGTILCRFKQRVVSYASSNSGRQLHARQVAYARWIHVCPFGAVICMRRSCSSSMKPRSNEAGLNTRENGPAFFRSHLPCPKQMIY